MQTLFTCLASLSSTFQIQSFHHKKGFGLYEYGNITGCRLLHSTIWKCITCPSLSLTLDPGTAVPTAMCEYLHQRSCRNPSRCLATTISRWWYSLPKSWQINETGYLTLFPNSVKWSTKKSFGEIIIINTM